MTNIVVLSVFDLLINYAEDVIYLLEITQELILKICSQLIPNDAHHKLENFQIAAIFESVIYRCLVDFNWDLEKFVTDVSENSDRVLKSIIMKNYHHVTKTVLNPSIEVIFQISSMKKNGNLSSEEKKLQLENMKKELKKLIIYRAFNLLKKNYGGLQSYKFLEKVKCFLKFIHQISENQEIISYQKLNTLDSFINQIEEKIGFKLCNTINEISSNFITEFSKLLDHENIEDVFNCKKLLFDFENDINDGELEEKMDDCCLTYENTICLKCSICKSSLSINAWIKYLNNRITQSNGFFVSCPICNCVLDQRYWVKFDDNVKLTDNFISKLTENMNSYKNCRSLDCNGIIKINPIAEKNSLSCCDDCYNFFCVQCGFEQHYPISCHLISKWNDIEIKDSMNQDYLRVYCKKCPKCDKLIYKDQGCLHMRCICSHEFCWYCLNNWDSHKDDFVCLNLSDKRMSEQSHLDPVQETLKIFEYYYSRYVSCLVSQKFLKNEIKERIKYLDENAKKGLLPTISTNFIKILWQVLDAVIKANNNLKLSYCQLFFLHDNYISKYNLTFNIKTIIKLLETIYELFEIFNLKKSNSFLYAKISYVNLLNGLYSALNDSNQNISKVMEMYSKLADSFSEKIKI